MYVYATTLNTPSRSPPITTLLPPSTDITSKQFPPRNFKARRIAHIRPIARGVEKEEKCPRVRARARRRESDRWAGEIPTHGGSRLASRQDISAERAGASIVSIRSAPFQVIGHEMRGASERRRLYNAREKKITLKKKEVMDLFLRWIMMRLAMADGNWWRIFNFGIMQENINAFVKI